MIEIHADGVPRLLFKTTREFPAWHSACLNCELRKASLPDFILMESPEHLTIINRPFMERIGSYEGAYAPHISSPCSRRYSTHCATECPSRKQHFLVFSARLYEEALVISSLTLRLPIVRTNCPIFTWGCLIGAAAYELGRLNEAFYPAAATRVSYA